MVGVLRIDPAPPLCIEFMIYDYPFYAVDIFCLVFFCFFFRVCVLRKTSRRRRSASALAAASAAAAAADDDDDRFRDSG